MEIVQLAAEETHALRRSVLREGRADLPVTFPEDDRDGAFHLGARQRDRLLAVASLSPDPTPWRPGANAYRLRGMAVDRRRQGRGVGRLVLVAACDELRTRSAAVLWANARDSALGFYERFGMQVVGEQFAEGPFSLPHHVVVLDLA